MSTPAGYRLLVEPGELDLERFERCATKAGARWPPGSRSAPRRACARRSRSGAARRWPTSPSRPSPRRRSRGWRTLRAAALEDRIEADLQLGRHGELVAELEALVARDPLRERPRGQLMLALYRAGRQGDALEAYRRRRERSTPSWGCARAGARAPAAGDPRP